jgi:hypothetical protein
MISSNNLSYSESSDSLRCDSSAKSGLPISGTADASACSNSKTAWVSITWDCASGVDSKSVDGGDILSDDGSMDEGCRDDRGVLAGDAGVSDESGACAESGNVMGDFIGGV